MFITITTTITKSYPIRCVSYMNRMTPYYSIVNPVYFKP